MDFSKYVSKIVSIDHLELLAKQTGFIQRTSRITPESFFNTVFFSNAQNCPTLTDYSIDLVSGGVDAVSKQAIDKRFSENTKSMLTHLLQDIISSQIKRRSTVVHSQFSEIRIM
jgi:hypothetical protein